MLVRATLHVAKRQITDNLVVAVGPDARHGAQLQARQRVGAQVDVCVLSPEHLDDLLIVPRRATTARARRLQDRHVRLPGVVARGHEAARLEDLRSRLDEAGEPVTVVARSDLLRLLACLNSVHANEKTSCLYERELRATNRLSEFNSIATNRRFTSEFTPMEQRKT